MKFFLYLRIAGHALDFDQIISDLHAYFPYKIMREGEECSKRFHPGKVHTEDIWLSEYTSGEEELIESALYDFISAYLPAKESIRELSALHDVSFVCSVYPDDNQCGIKLSKKVISAASDMQASIRIDAAFLKEFYEGSYKK